MAAELEEYKRWLQFDCYSAAMCVLRKQKTADPKFIRRFIEAYNPSVHPQQFLYEAAKFAAEVAKARVGNASEELNA